MVMERLLKNKIIGKIKSHRRDMFSPENQVMTFQLKTMEYLKIINQ